ncbi:MAG: hypothetical protein LC105_07515 [Chitinophagales bacterium]|nr:hypothetical protein [Chitinophagales bacterium]
MRSLSASTKAQQPLVEMSIYIEYSLGMRPLRFGRWYSEFIELLSDGRAAPIQIHHQKNRLSKKTAYLNIKS